MARTQIRGSKQIKDFSVNRTKLFLDFLGAADWDLTNGAKNATIKGLADAVLPDSPATLSQLNAAIGGLQGMTYKGSIDVSLPSPDLATLASSSGDFYIVSVGGLYLGKTWVVGDMMIVNKNVAIGAILGSDLDKIDNTVDPTTLFQADVVDSLLSNSAIAPLSANQGFVLKGLIDGISANVKLRVYGEEPAITPASAVLGALANVPVAGTLRVFLNGELQKAGAGFDYTLVGQVITLSGVIDAGDIVQCNYEY